jgi:alpha-L-rhamnosidase
VLTVTGLGLYRAFLNGKRIGMDYLTPGFNDYDAYLREQTYDVTALLEKENRLEVWLGNGWYKGRLGFGGGKENRWGDRYLLAARLEKSADRTENQRKAA